jgi:hypothetical protein
MSCPASLNHPNRQKMKDDAGRHRLRAIGEIPRSGKATAGESTGCGPIPSRKAGSGDFQARPCRRRPPPRHEGGRPRPSAAITAEPCLLIVGRETMEKLGPSHGPDRPILGPVPMLQAKRPDRFIAPVRATPAWSRTRNRSCRAKAAAKSAQTGCLRPGR